MDVSRPYSAVCPGLEGEVLRVLAGTNAGMTGRQVALLTGRTSHSGVLGALHRLAEHGLVDRVELNRAFLFALNRDHLAAPAVEILVGMRQELFDRIRDALAEWWLAPLHASVFGSTARGDGDTDSDIDLLVVRPSTATDHGQRWQDQIETLETQIRRWTGNRAAIMDASIDELERLRSASRVFQELRADAIVLSGPAIDALPVPA